MKLTTLTIGIALSICFLFPSDSYGCSWVTKVGENDSRVLVIGRIKGHAIEPLGGRRVFGVVIEPILEYRSVPKEGEEQYSVFPHGVGADCSDQYFEHNVRLEEHFAAGKLVTVIGYESERISLGNLGLSWGSGLDVVSAECSVADTANSQYLAATGSKSCGTELFYIYRDIARLASAGGEESIEILTRLSQVEVITDFESLVNKYVSSDDRRRSLLRMRYGHAMETGCATEPEFDRNYDADYVASRIERLRWFEYCTQGRRDAASSGTEQ